MAKEGCKMTLSKKLEKSKKAIKIKKEIEITTEDGKRVTLKPSDRIVYDFEINFEGDIKFSFNEKTNKIDRYIYINKQWILLKR
jgi:UDP-3-O-acyl-N-acetylglucosamine deacetylase